MMLNPISTAMNAIKNNNKPILPITLAERLMTAITGNVWEHILSIARGLLYKET